ncbi:MAG: hypothetical protein Q4G24_15525 [Paracoccus sp. (in: a-proteobacteria)]|uniref:hypothetical protein n=1 Tax=Paracoccus sp. TaxID=267 RepID=UPI0026E0A99E|nr:hypothetical protein [Paracoccus sp. (in: a-proteobacteria)]MDO5622858.1 hypothetical protein [Paracoccus sp. (in: a-proteobacteria)]
MNDFRYMRMAENDQGWERPHGGRKGGEDGYVGTQSIGYEDWNFSRDLWKDGRYHLYLRQTPKDFEDGVPVNFVLGAYASGVSYVVGFAENAVHGVSELPDSVVKRRAEEIFALNEGGDLGEGFAGKSVNELARILKWDAREFKVSVAPGDLHVLVQPVPMSEEIYKVSMPGYRVLSMEEDAYNALKSQLLSGDIRSSVESIEEVSFPEDALVERWHQSRERNRAVVDQAKSQFIKKNKRLFCEVCGFEPENYFGSKEMRNRIIEAHHDVALSDKSTPGKQRCLT